MKKFIGVALAAACACPSQAAGEQTKLDTTRVNNLNEVVVKAVRAPKSSPFAVENIKKTELERFASSGKELPWLFARTPGVLAWSENGVGTGTVYMRMRGAAGSRINVTVDGVPLNSPEDQCVFWANMNSYAALMGSAQIQRGIGASTNGDGAFGGSVSLATAAPSLKPTVEVTGSYGSFNTYRVGGNFSTGLLADHFIIDGAYHETNTDGYIHGTGGRSGSYYGGLTWLGDRFKLSYKNIGNFEHTGQAWNGVAACNYDGDTDLKAWGINSYKDMWKHGLGKFNSLYEELVIPMDDNWAADPTKPLTTERYKMRDGSYWKQTTDNFEQSHNILNFTWQPADMRWSHSVTAHYTYGYGYYTEFKKDTKLASKFGINEMYEKNGELKPVKSDAIRKKGLTQNNYGALYNVNYKDALWDVMGGFSMQLFRCNHWGKVTYIADEALEKKYFTDGRYKYYDSDANKNDWSWFFKANRKFGNGWNWFLDMQMRYVNYNTDGLNDHFEQGADGNYKNQSIDINENYFFVNPKAGISYDANGHKAYASIAYANREPERNNFTDNIGYGNPSPERLLDLEWGYQYQGENWFAGVNFYYMKYVNQFVMTGEKSDIGESLTRNIKDSYRLGAEVSAGWSPLSWLSLEGNAALSRNRLKNFKECVESWDGPAVWNTYKSSTIAFSPSAILNGFVDVHFAGVRATWHTNFVSKQYLDNTESSERSLPCYSQTNVNASYTFNFAKRVLGLKQVVLGADFNNIFDRHYAASGYVYYDWYNNNKRNSTVAYIPMAGFNCLGTVTLKF
ncbi:MAG: TonB-dependent receptor plug domain-containing protein [Prevotella sp.]|nr:TonB-dependent receptor plug domain-containing protein [Prevotella sp.]MDY5306991.1 TonB-dependent receptor plug domain-containing protein [Prevotella sp.]